MTRAPFQDAVHAVHDYRRLVARWRRVARDAGLKLAAFAEVGEYPVYCLRTRGSLDGGLYLSAGIHGDEPAGPEALLRWAETRLRRLVRHKHPLPLLLLPCLNPWGLINNRRTDARDRDLNRIFDKKVSPIRELKNLLAGHRFALAVALHEDYDARGIYLYEIKEARPEWGESLLRVCSSPMMPIESRHRIEGRTFKDGCMARRIKIENIPLHPEALYLYLHHAPHVLTFETPSEFSLTHRVQAHILLIEE